MSLCDRCYAPGQCCKRLVLTRKSGLLTTWAGEGEVEKQMADMGLPFVSIGILQEWEGDEDGPYVQHLFTCPLIQPDGRCGGYDNRPQLCRDFEPGSEALCVHYQGAESGDASA